MKTAHIPLTALAGLLALTLSLVTGCNGGTDTPDPNAASIQAPCDFFTEEIAAGLGNGPYKSGIATVNSRVSICQRVGEVGAANIYGATVRFEKMSKGDFLGQACKVPLNPETNQALYDVDTLDGIHVAACRFKPFGEEYVGISVLDESGWAVMVGSAPQAKCLEAIEKMLPKLPR